MDISGGALPSSERTQNISNSTKGKLLGSICIALLLTFSWIPNSYSASVSWPWILLWQTAFLLAGAWCIWTLRQFSIPFRFLGYGLDWIVIAALFVATISALQSDFKVVGLWNALLLSNYAVTLYISVHWLRNGLSRHFLWLITAISGFVTSVIGIAFWQPSPEMWLSNNFNTALRNSWPLGHHNFVGGYELLTFPIVLSFFWFYTGWRRYLSAIAAAIVAFSLYISGSRGALVGAIAMVVVFGSAFLIRRRKNLSKRSLIAVTCVLLAVAFLVFSNPRMRTLFSLSVSPEANSITATTALSDGPARDRIFMLQATQNILSVRPMFGVGPGNLSRVYNLYRPTDAGTGLDLVQQMHNMPAQILSELGIIGFTTYIAWLIGLTKIGIKLKQKIQKRDQYIFCGITASFLGYAVSSLTDYQLENIGISMTLLVMTASLINLGDEYIDSSSATLVLSHKHRRVLSLCILAVTCASLQIWLRFDAGLYLAKAASNNIRMGNIVAADNNWSKASSLVPWDPTYAVLAAEQLVSIKKGAANLEDKKELTKSALEYLESTTQSAPNDPWFNQNLATLAIENNDPKKAEWYALRASQLFPRNHSLVYYTLGLSYLEQNLTEKAVTAFSLEALAKPSFLFTDLWSTEPFIDLLPAVVNKILDSYHQILSETNTLSAQYRWIHEQLSLLSWWYHKPLTDNDISTLRPVAKTLVEIGRNPELAKEIIDEQQKTDSDNRALLLLRAWLSPEEHLDSFLEKFTGTEAEKALLKKHIENNRDIRSWLNSILKLIPARYRGGVSFAYRNAYADYIRQVMHPGELRESFLFDLLGLFQNAPQIFPQLDQEIERIKAEQLSILPLKSTQFKISK